jgi:hypothetical protein
LLLDVTERECFFQTDVRCEVVDIARSFVRAQAEATQVDVVGNYHFFHLLDEFQEISMKEAEYNFNMLKPRER